jgi:AcrR family transcriptional regulator
MGRNCSPKDWVLAAVERMSSGGPAASIQVLAADLGVTEGSFYHHFRNRAALDRAVAEWRAGPDPAQRLADALAGIRSPVERLRRMHAVARRSARLDAALRQMAREDTAIAGALLRADEAAAAAFTAAFAELGFRGDEAGLRARMLIALSRAQHEGIVAADDDDFEGALALLSVPGGAPRDAARAAAHTS